MKRRTKSLRSRLTTLVVVAIFGAVAIVTVSSVWRETTRYRAGKFTELNAAANIFASAISEQVSEGDKPGALNALKEVSRIPSTEYVRIDDAAGKLFVEMGDADILNAEAKSGVTRYGAKALFEAQTTITSAPIVRNGENFGTLTIYANAGTIYNRIGILIYDAMVAAIFAAGIGLLIALRMQRSITDPILNLAGVMGKVRESGDFSMRASKGENEDETSQLVDAFNEMLDQLQERDAKLQAHQRDLKKIVQRRTQQLQNAKEVAEAASVAKTEFLATMSHEIRTPMNGMMVMAELLSKAQLPPRQKRYAEVISKSGQSLLAIINDILDLSKIEAGRLELESIPVKPVEIIDDIVSLFWEQATTKGVDLAAYVAPNTPETIEGDPVRIRQVISNLVNNALKFTEKGHVIVSARRVVGHGRACVVEFSVADTGVGIPKEKQTAIFEAFSQADQTTTRKFGGTGLGLAISSKLVEAMQGSINVSSQHNKGARFFFSFPTNIVDAAPDIHAAIETRRALIALNGTATPQTLARYLKEAGIVAEIVDSGDHADVQTVCADMIFATPAFLDSLQTKLQDDKQRWTPARICISELGDSAPDRLLEMGVAEDLLIAPLSRRDVMEQIDRILAGKLRGKAALQSIGGDRAEAVRYGGQRVLAADDSAVNREVVKEALTRLNLKPTLVADGLEAVAATKQTAFDLVLMDCSMPEMDGYEATKAIRRLEAAENRSPLPIIALTAHASDDVEKWREAGMNDYLTKPYTIDSLSRMIGKYLEQSSTPAAPAADDSGDLPAPSTADDPFDRAVLGQLAAMQAGAGDLVLRTLRLFQEHSRPAMTALAQAMATSDHGQIAMAAHALKSMSVNVGAHRLAGVCGKMEILARKGAALSDLAPLAESAGTEYAAVHRALPRLLQEYAQNAA